MAFFIYSYQNRDGQTIRQYGQFETAYQLERELNSQGCRLTHHWEMSELLAHLSQWLGSRQVKRPDISAFCHDMSMFIAGGIDLQTALTDLVSSARSSAMKHALIEIQSSLHAGYQFSQSLEKTHVFPEVVVGMIKMGEESGNLGEMLKEAGLYLDRQMAISSATRKALIYPLLVLLVVGGAIGFWMVAVVPQLVGMFQSFQATLPKMTQMIISLSSLLSRYALWWLIGLVFWLVVTVIAWSTFDRARYWMDRILWVTPVIGKIIQGSSMAFYFQYLAMLYAAGIPINTALTQVAETMSNRFFRSRLEHLEATLQGGGNMASAFQSAEIFEPLAKRMVSIAEQTGNLEQQLQKLAQIYFDRVQSLVEVLSKVLEPVIMIVIGTIFAIMFVALMGPVYDLIRHTLSVM